MRRKRVLIGVGVVLAVAAIAGAGLEFRARNLRLARLARDRLIDQEHCARIWLGMSQAEVEAILGGPPGDFTAGRVTYIGGGDYAHPPLRGPEPVLRWEQWSGNAGRAQVGFDEQGAVWGWRFQYGLPQQPPSLAEQIRAWLRRAWP